MADYIPAADPDFHNWQDNFMDYFLARATLLGLDSPDYAHLQTMKDTWDNAYPSHIMMQANARAYTEAKNTARNVYEDALRLFVRRLQILPTMTDEHRQGLGITVENTTGATTVSLLTAPVAVVDNSQRLQHLVQFFDSGTPTKRAKPAWASGCEIWVKIGDPAPIDGTQCQMLGYDTATPYLAQYQGADGGKTAHYMLRWVLKDGYRGPWSETASVTISA